MEIIYCFPADRNYYVSSLKGKFSHADYYRLSKLSVSFAVLFHIVKGKPRAKVCQHYGFHYATIIGTSLPATTTSEKYGVIMFFATLLLLSIQTCWRVQMSTLTSGYMLEWISNELLSAGNIAIFTPTASFQRNLTLQAQVDRMESNSIHGNFRQGFVTGAA